MTRATSTRTKPDWPAMMDPPTAADYLSLSEGSFLGLARRKGVRPVDLGLASVRYRRKDLDALIDSLQPTDAKLGPQESPTVVDEAAMALERARRRIRR